MRCNHESQQTQSRHIAHPADKYPLATNAKIRTRRLALWLNRYCLLSRTNTRSEINASSAPPMRNSMSWLTALPVWVYLRFTSAMFFNAPQYNDSSA